MLDVGSVGSGILAVCCSRSILSLCVVVRRKKLMGRWKTPWGCHGDYQHHGLYIDGNIYGSSLSNVRSSPSNCQIEKSLLKVFLD